MLRERPVARLSAALEGTNPSSSAAAETFSCVLRETEPRPDSARDAVDFDTPASFATSASVLTRLTLVRKLAEDGGFELPLASTHVNADYDIFPHSSGFECTKSERNRAEKQLTTSRCTHNCTHGSTFGRHFKGKQNCAPTPPRLFFFLRPWPTWAASSPAHCGRKRKQK